MAEYSIGIDIGTSSIKGILIDETFQVVAQDRRPITSFFPKPAWVEQDPDEICRMTEDLIRALLEDSHIPPDRVCGIGLDHQGESCLIWDKTDGRPVYPVITWQDRRTTEAAAALRRQHGEAILSLTGQPADSYYSAFKLRWILDHIPDGQARAEAGDLLAGTLNTYVFWRLSGGSSFITDVASANCTLLFDPRADDWDQGLLDLFGLPRTLLPQIVPAVGFGPVPTIFGIPVMASAPDSHAGIYGINAIRSGCLTTTYGTGNFMHLSVGNTYKSAAAGLTATNLYSSSKERIFQLNGICYTAGSAVKWLSDGLGILEDESAASDIAAGVPDCCGVSFIPAFTGLATPYWDEDARGALIGLTAGVRPAHIVRAVLESIAFQVANAAEVMQSVSGLVPERIYALGGMTANEFLMQFQADVSGIPIIVPEQSEPCFGAAAMARSAVLQIETADEWRFHAGVSRCYEPRMKTDERLTRLENWKQAVDRCLTSRRD